ncbi:MAG TPA: oligosaccharide flippase family protein [bacterium]|nr:oligosaccharide flippase family protein [bacterium]
MVEDSLRKRYFYKLFTNIAGYAIGLITMGIIPRALGPKAFGDFNFLTNFFNQVVNFLDMGSSTAFFTKISQRQKESSLFAFYLWFTVLVTILILLGVSLAGVFRVHQRLWPGQNIIFVYCGALWAILNWVFNVLNQATDAYGLTVSAEIKKLYQKIFSVMLILILFYNHLINLASFFIYQYAIQIFIILSFFWVLKQNRKLPYRWKMTQEQTRYYGKEFFVYCYPLFFYSLFSLLTGIFDRWILQYYSGSVQQGFYGLGYQIGTICLIFTSSMTPLFIREFSMAYGNQDRDRMIFLFRRYIPFLYVITAYFSCFAATQADVLIKIFGGSQYSAALLPVILMCIFPIHSTYGQLSGSVFLATGQTKLYRNLGVPFMIFGSMLTYILIAPQDKFGLNMGASGLAIKMVLLQFILVNVQLFFNAKFLGISFIRYFVHQIIVIVLFLAIGIDSRFFGDFLLRGTPFIFSFIFSGLVYTAVCIVCAFYYPRVFGLYRDDIEFFLRFFQFKDLTAKK